MFMQVKCAIILSPLLVRGVYSLVDANSEKEAYFISEIDPFCARRLLT